jgi:hypothetical protein
MRVLERATACERAERVAFDLAATAGPRRAAGASSPTTPYQLQKA